MTEDINHYAFDFAREAAALLARLGRKGKRVLIAETNVTHPQGLAAKVDVQQIVGNTWLKRLQGWALREHINYTYSKMPRLGSYATANYISLRKNDKFASQFAPENRELLRLFILYHEASHVLTWPLPEKNARAGERAADAYAALSLLQRFGNAALPLLAAVSRLRAQEDSSHLTAPVLDKIIADSARHDFTAMTPDILLRRATAYANASDTPADKANEASRITDSISHYSFDFAREAADLRRNLGALGENIVFVETESIPGADGNAEIRFHRAVGDRQAKSKLLPGIRKDIKLQHDRHPGLGSFHSVHRAGGKANPYVSLNEKHWAATLLGDANRPLLTLFMLCHETGHALIPGKRPSEAAADAYAALRLLQRFGDEARPFLSMFSWARAIESVFSGSTNHVTTTVLDKIVSDSGRRGNFKSLAPDETVALAAKYAEDWMPKGIVLVRAEQALEKAVSGGIFKPALLAGTCLSSPPNDFTFYIAARILKPYLDMEEVTCNGNADRLDGEQKTAVRTAIVEQNRKMIAGIFNGHAADDNLPFIYPAGVILPPGQKQLVYNNYLAVRA